MAEEEEEEIEITQLESEYDTTLRTEAYLPPVFSVEILVSIIVDNLPLLLATGHRKS